MRSAPFRDRHCHPLFAGREMNAIDISSSRSVDEAIEALRAYLIQDPNRAWIDVVGFDLARNPEASAKDLDAVSKDIPITVHTNDHHALWVNSAALKIAGLNERIPALDNGSVQVDQTGGATGLLFEWPAMSLVLDQMPTPSLEDDIVSLTNADKVLDSGGFVAATDAWIDPGMAEVYFEAGKRGLLKLKYDLAVRISAESQNAQFEYLEKMLEAEAEQLSSTRNVRIAGVKIFLDGVVSSKTAALLGPYRDGTVTSPIWQLEELIEVLKRLSSMSPLLRPHFHAIGDAAVRQALDAIEVARELKLWSEGAMPVIAHAELIAESDFSRFAQLQAEVVISPQWLQPKSLEIKNPLTNEDSERLGDFTWLLLRDAPASYGSDWPVSEPEPLLAKEVALAYLAARKSLSKNDHQRAIEKLNAVFSGELVVNNDA